MQNPPLNRQQTLNEEIRTVRQFMTTLESMKKFMQKFLDQENALVESPKNDTEQLRELTDLRILAKSESWPLAMDENKIVQDTEEEKLHHSAQYINFVLKNKIYEKKVLDFGCKEGHLGYVASTLFNTSLMCSYDLENHNWDHFEKSENLIYTNNWDDVVSHGPYDVININDVIDHSQEFDKSLEKIIKVKSESGRIYVRCHPWTSRHGGHLENQLNKAYLHLVFTENELYQLGVKPTNVAMFTDPLATYSNLFKQAGLTIMREYIHRKSVELFFVHNPTILRRIKEKWKNSNSADKFPREILEIEYVDFTLM
jgi:2-polyprenyl-3-methyl-5-hydroxy-6-metoxy-1,4-benzoquinol methylase